MRRLAFLTTRGTRSFVVLSIGRAASLVLQAIVVALQARALGVDDFGTFSSVLAAGYFLMMFFDFGLSVRALRINAEENLRTGRDLLLVRLASLAAILIASLLWLGLTQPSRFDIYLILATCVFLAGDLCGELCTSLLLGERRRTEAMLGVMLRRLVNLLPFVFGLSMMTVAAGLVFSGAVGLIQSVSLCLRLPGRGLPDWSVTLRESAPYWGTSIGSSLQKCDVLLVRFAGGSILAGLYGGATRLSSPLNAVTSVLLQFGVPELASTSGPARLQAFRTMSRLIFGWSALLVVLSLFSKPLTEVLLGSSFARAWPLVMAVMLSAAVSAVAQAALAWHLAEGLPPGLPTAMTAVVGLGLTILVAATLTIGTWGTVAGLLSGNVLVLSVILRSLGSAKRLLKGS